MMKSLLFSLLCLILSISCSNTGQSKTENSDITEKDSLHTSMDNKRFHKKIYPLYKTHHNSAEIRMKKREISLSKKDSISYSIYNHTNYNVLAGYPFTVEYWDNVEWIDVPLNIGFVHLGLPIQKGSHSSFQYDTSVIKDSFLKEGEFRIVTNVYITEKKSELEKNVYLYTEFLLVK